MRDHIVTAPGCASCWRSICRTETSAGAVVQNCRRCLIQAGFAPAWRASAWCVVENVGIPPCAHVVDQRPPQRGCAGIFPAPPARFQAEPACRACTDTARFSAESGWNANATTHLPPNDFNQPGNRVVHDRGRPCANKIFQQSATFIRVKVSSAASGFSFDWRRTHSIEPSANAERIR